MPRITAIAVVFLSASVVLAQPNPPVTLEEVARTAMDRHQDVGKARAAADALKGKIKEVRAQALPEINLTAGSIRWRDPSLLNASGLDKFPPDLLAAMVPSAVNLFDYSLSVKQPIFTQGKIGTALRLASVEAEGSLAEIDRARQDIALAATKAYFGLLWAERYHNLVAETQEQKKQHAEMARTRFSNGVATRVDVLRSEVAVANGAPDLVRAENDIRQARAVVNYYIGRALDAPTQLAGEFQEKAWEQPDLDALEREALRRRPELARLRLAEKSAQTQVSLARAENRLRVDFSAAYGLMAREPQNLIDRKFARWSTGLSFTLPVFEGGKRSGLVRQATANERSAALEREKVEQQIRLAIQQAFDEQHTAAETVAAARANVEQAREVLNMMQSNYQYGAATTLDVMDAQTAVSVARGNLLRGLYDSSVARANLRWAAGMTPWE